MSVFLRTRSPKLLKGHTRSVRRGLAIRNNKLYSASVDGTIRVWNTDTHEEIAILKVEVEEPLKGVTCFVIHEFIKKERKRRQIEQILSNYSIRFFVTPSHLELSRNCTEDQVRFLRVEKNPILFSRQLA